MPPKRSPASSSKPTTTTVPRSSTWNSKTTATGTTLVLFLLLVLCLFPSLFHFLWTLPLGLLFPSPPHHKPPPLAPNTQTSTTAARETMWFQKQFTLPPRARGSYLITDTVLKELPEIRSYKVGLLHLFIQHTSCALSLNENWDAVRYHLLSLYSFQSAIMSSLKKCETKDADDMLIGTVADRTSEPT